MPLYGQLPANRVVGNPNHPPVHNSLEVALNQIRTTLGASIPEELDSADILDLAALVVAFVAHAADATAIHGIADTSALETTTGAQTKADAAAAASAAALVAHTADTTAIHGIADTSALVLTDDTRLSNQRVPTDSSVTIAKLAAATLARILTDPTAASDGSVMQVLNEAWVLGDAPPVVVSTDDEAEVRPETAGRVLWVMEPDQVPTNRVAGDLVATRQVATPSVPPGSTVFSALTTYTLGDRVTYGGHTYELIIPTLIGVAPRGVGDGTQADRDLLMAYLQGAGEDTVGGYADDSGTAVVTRLDDPDKTNPPVGTLRYWIEKRHLAEGVRETTPVWIIFDPDLDVGPDSDTILQLGDHGSASCLQGYSLTTIDARAIPRLRVMPSNETSDRPTLVFHGGNSFTGIVPDGGMTLHDIIIAGGNWVAPRGGTSGVGGARDAIVLLGKGSVGQTGTLEKVWLAFARWAKWADYFGITASTDYSDEGVGIGNNLSKATISHCYSDTMKNLLFGSTATLNDGGTASLLRCLLEGVNDRCPRVSDAFGITTGLGLHAYNNVIRYWGTGSAMNVAQGARALIEANCYEPVSQANPYRARWGKGATDPVVSSELIAAKTSGNSPTPSALKNNGGHLLIPNAEGQSPIINPSSAGSVTDPTWGFTIAAMDQALADAVEADAGPVSPWRLIS